MCKTFYIVRNGRGIAYCNPIEGMDRVIPIFGTPNADHTNVVRYDNHKNADKTAEQLNQMFGCLQRYKTDKFKCYFVCDRTEDCAEAFNFICDFAKKYIAYTYKDYVDLCVSTSETALEIDGSRYYTVKLTENGFKCGRWYKFKKFDHEEFTLDGVKTIIGNGSRVPPIIVIASRIKWLYRDLLENENFKNVLEAGRFKTTEEKAQWLQDQHCYKDDAPICLGKSLPYIAEMVAKTFGDDVVEIHVRHGLVCRGSAKQIAWETDRLMPYPKSNEHINNEDATTLYYGSRPIAKGEWLPFLANADRFHIGSFEIKHNVPVFHLVKGVSEDVLMC